MTPEQALNILAQAFVTKIGLAVSDVNLVTQAWKVIAELVEKSKEKTE